jgi:hypothetical protein
MTVRKNPDGNGTESAADRPPARRTPRTLRVAAQPCRGCGRHERDAGVVVVGAGFRARAERPAAQPI